jgi:hypothetical protein
LDQVWALSEPTPDFLTTPGLLQPIQRVQGQQISIINRRIMIHLSMHSMNDSGYTSEVDANLRGKNRNGDVSQDWSLYVAWHIKMLSSLEAESHLACACLL